MIETPNFVLFVVRSDLLIARGSLAPLALTLAQAAETFRTKIAQG